MEDPFGEELGRRTAGVESEEGLLEFMRGVDGVWGSRRKRRRIVDAAEFGDVFPVGWRLLLGIRRKEGRAWIYCRRYVSPSGHHFVSCKDVSLYLQSIRSQNTDQQHQDYGHPVEEIQGNRYAIENQAGLIFKDGDQRKDVNSSPTVPVSVVNAHENEMILLGIDNLADVQIQDLFECHKCNKSFADKDSYLQHLLSVHQKTTRRYKLGSSVSEGVIIKDGKYECQFCHKVFMERRRYNGHVGIHVRNYVKRVGEEEVLAGSTPNQNTEAHLGDDSSPRTSKMDALVEIAHNSILETSDGQQVDTAMIDQDLSNQQCTENEDKSYSASGIDNVDMVSVSDIDALRNIEKPIDIDADKNSEMEIDDSALDPTNNIAADTVEQIFGVEPICDDETGLEELKLEDIEPLKYSFEDSDEEYVSLQDVPIDLANSTEIESVFGSSPIQFESVVILNVGRIDPTNSVCACGTEFNHQNNLDSKTPRESVVSVCQNCNLKDKTQQNELDYGSPVNPNSL